MKIALQPSLKIREKAIEYLNKKNEDMRDLVANYLSIKEQIGRTNYKAGSPEEHQQNKFYLTAYAMYLSSSQFNGGKYSEEIEQILRDTYLNGEDYEKLIIRKLTDKLNGNDVRKYLSDINKTTEVIIEKSSGNYINLLKRIRIISSGTDIKLDDIAGLEYAKREIDKFVKAYSFSNIYEKNNARMATGILFYGPPGTGKTMLGKAMANELDFNFMEVRLPEIASKYFGESEKTLHNIFKKAREQPTILFFDELDALARDRNEYETGANIRIVSTLLMNLDGIVENKNVIPVGATNLIEKIDKALLRPGRFSKHISVPLPNLSTRKKMFEIKIRNSNAYSLNKGGKGVFQDFDEEDYLYIAEMTNNFSGAQINEVLEIVKENKAYDEANSKKRNKINIKNIENVIKQLRRTAH